MTRRISVAVMLLIALVPQAHAACRPSDFEIKQLELSEIIAGYAKIVGDVVSHCTTPAAAGLRMTLRTSDGRVVAVGKRYVGASTFENIAPGESAPFEHVLPGKLELSGFALGDLKVEGKIVDVLHGKMERER